MVTCIVVAGMTGCSLVTIKTPERPLSARDLSARVLTRDYSTKFVAAVEKCALDIAASEVDSTVLDSSLRWQIVAVAQSRRAATRTAPLMSLLDTWAFAAQMSAFVAPGGAGSSLFGAHQDDVRAMSAELAAEATGLAQRLLAKREFAEYGKFVETYVREHPLEDLQFVRASVEEQWSRQTGTTRKLADSFGTIPQALEDLGDRLQIYGDTVPSQVAWKGQLLMRESGYSQSDFDSTLRRLDDRFDQLTAAADAAPELTHGLVADFRQSLFQVIDRLNASSMATIGALGVERGALTGDLREERAAVLRSVDAERQAFALDAARITTQVIRETGEQARSLVREAIALITILAVVLLGGPFAIGYLVGRERGRRTPPPR
jgi:hypothetical protein